MFMFWATIMDLELLMCRFIRSLREGHFPLYVQVCDELYFAQFTAKPKGCVYTALQLGGDVEQPRITNKYDVIHKYISSTYIKDHYAAERRTEPRPQVTCTKKSQSRRCRVTVLGKLLTPIVPLQQNW